MKQPRQPGRYDLTDRIARGGVAEVYRAKTVGVIGSFKDVAVRLLLPQELSQIACKATAKDRAACFGNADEIQDALSGFLHNQTTQVSRHSTTQWRAETFAPSILAEQRTQMADAPFFASLQRQRAQPSPAHPQARGRPPAAIP